ncbi:hypothetical protein AB0J28_05505 [Streptosporangium canum]|uniref:hypothetical protein n=1 Tax=Streptosporangium canum TaxID=324952 RepID=UPI00341E1871
MKQRIPRTPATSATVSQATAYETSPNTPGNTIRTALVMMEVMCHLLPEGREIGAEDVAQLSPYRTAHISRFDLYATDVLRLRPDDSGPDLPEIDFTALAEAA